MADLFMRQEADRPTYNFSIRNLHGSKSEKRKKQTDKALWLAFTTWQHQTNDEMHKVNPSPHLTYRQMNKVSICMSEYENLAQSHLGSMFPHGLGVFLERLLRIFLLSTFLKLTERLSGRKGKKKETFQLAIQLSNYFIMCWRAGRRMAMCFLSSSVLPLVVMTTASILFSLSPTVSYSAALDYLRLFFLLLLIFNLQY